MTHCPHCGCDLHPKSRSLPQHRRFFGVLRAMFNHWPETAEFQPESEEHLRKWAIAKAGYRTATDIAVPYAEEEPGLTRLVSISIEAAVRGAGGFAFVRPHPEGGLVRVYTARSIAFDKLGQAEFNALNDAVETVYARETGLDPETVLRENERAA